MANRDLFQEIDQIINQEYSSKQELKKNLNRLLKIIPERKTSYKPSGKTTVPAVLYMFLISIVSLITTYIILLVTQNIASFLIDLLDWMPFMSIISTLILFFVIMIPLWIASFVSGFSVATIGKKWKNRNKYIPLFFASIPFLILSVIFSLEIFSKERLPLGEINRRITQEDIAISVYIFILSITFLIGTIISGAAAYLEFSEQRFNENLNKFYSVYALKKCPLKFAPEIQELLLEEQNLDSGSQEDIKKIEKIKSKIINMEEESNNYFKVLFYIIPKEERDYNGYIEVIIDLDINYKNYKKEKESFKKSWCSFSQTCSKERLEYLFSYFKDIASIH